MAGLVPAIHVLVARTLKDMDARDKRGHDGGEVPSPSHPRPHASGIENPLRIETFLDPPRDCARGAVFRGEYLNRSAYRSRCADQSGMAADCRNGGTDRGRIGLISRRHCHPNKTPAQS